MQYVLCVVAVITERAMHRRASQPTRGWCRLFLRFLTGRTIDYDFDHKIKPDAHRWNFGRDRVPRLAIVFAASPWRGLTPTLLPDCNTLMDCLEVA